MERPRLRSLRELRRVPRERVRRSAEREGGSEMRNELTTRTEPRISLRSIRATLAETGAGAGATIIRRNEHLNQSEPSLAVLFQRSLMSLGHTLAIFSNGKPAKICIVRRIFWSVLHCPLSLKTIERFAVSPVPLVVFISSLPWPM